MSSIEKRGDTVYFSDGKKQDYDITIATGYKLHYPFIDTKHLNTNENTPNLFLNIFFLKKMIYLSLDLWKPPALVGRDATIRQSSLL